MGCYSSSSPQAPFHKYGDFMINMYNKQNNINLLILCWKVCIITEVIFFSHSYHNNIDSNIVMFMLNKLFHLHCYTNIFTKLLNYGDSHNWYSHRNKYQKIVNGCTLAPSYTKN